MLGSKLPQMTLLTATRKDAPDLKESFPHAQVEMVGEPRWDQVWSRAQLGHPRAKEIASCLALLPKPWGVLGSAWHEDIALWKNLIRSLGTVLIVPHRIDSEHLREIEVVLNSAGIKFLRTADYSSAEGFREALNLHSDVRCIVVNEMGFLSELYSAADWAYIGGGIGRRGVHSTIEPAIHGIPIACGPYRAHQFVEISELAETGQLTIVKTEDDLRRWVEGLREAFSHRERWKLDAKNRLGATERIVRRIINAL
jgi:3-deoxy-D-manno-octulosonic-acid transferase